MIDTLGLDDDRRRQYRDLAAAHGVACVAVGFDVEADECRARNRAATRPLPAAAIKQQLARWSEVRALLDDEGFAQVLRPEPVRQVAAHLASSAPLVTAEADRPAGLRIGLHISAFPWDDIADGLRATVSRPNEQASTASGRWTTSARSRRSGGTGTRCSRAARRWPGSRRTRPRPRSAPWSRRSPCAPSGCWPR